MAAPSKISPNMDKESSVRDADGTSVKHFTHNSRGTYPKRTKTFIMVNMFIVKDGHFNM